MEPGLTYTILSADINPELFTVHRFSKCRPGLSIVHKSIVFDPQDAGLTLTDLINKIPLPLSRERYLTSIRLYLIERTEVWGDQRTTDHDLVILSRITPDVLLCVFKKVIPHVRSLSVC